MGDAFPYGGDAKAVAQIFRARVRLLPYSGRLDDLLRLAPGCHAAPWPKLLRETRVALALRLADAINHVERAEKFGRNRHRAKNAAATFFQTLENNDLAGKVDLLGLLMCDRRRIASRNRTRAFGAELLDDRRRREIGHKHCRHEHRKDDDLCAVNNDVAGCAGDGQEEREDALKGELEKLYQAGEGKADGKTVSFERTETRRSRSSA